MMATLNRKTAPEKTTTHGGAIVREIKDAEEKLRRTVMTCMLWEDLHYEDGEDVATRILNYIHSVSPERCAQIAIEARSMMKLRHVPLLIVRQMARLDSHKYLVAKTLNEIIQRPDELSEFLAIYWKDDKEVLSAQVKKGLAAAFTKFDEYSLAKYDQDHDIKLRDVLFLCHSKPKTGIAGYTKTKRKRKHSVPEDEGSQLYHKLVTGTMKTPDTWEVEISAKGNNKESWERLIREKKLKDLAILRNLRNMEQAGVAPDIIREAIAHIKGDRVLPFRYISAAKYAAKYEPEIEAALFKALASKEKLPGKTTIIVDVSGSMYILGNVSAKSEMSRIDAACALAALARELCQEVVIYATAGNDATEVHATRLVPARRGFALAEAISKMKEPLGGGGIFLTQVIDYVKEKEKTADRILVITDEQDCDRHSSRSPDNARPFGKHNFILNISGEENGIGYGKWIHIHGWSEAVLDFIRVYEEGEQRSIERKKTPESQGSQNAENRTKISDRDSPKHVQANRTVRKRK